MACVSVLVGVAAASSNCGRRTAAAWRLCFLPAAIEVDRSSRNTGDFEGVFLLLQQQAVRSLRSFLSQHTALQRVGLWCDLGEGCLSVYVIG
jgi:hypothetical protein